VTRRGEELHLTPTEFAILHILVRNSSQVVTQHALLHEVWGKVERAGFGQAAGLHQPAAAQD
jgi:DNA-binding response OmpR family regulator